MNEIWNAAPDTGAARLTSPVTQVRQTPLPTNAADLCTRKYRNDAIRKAADLKYEEFKQMMVMARRLAQKKLNKQEHWVTQSQTAKQNFLKAARSQFPLLDEYEEYWPITLYITRYLDNTSRWRVSPSPEASTLVSKPELIRNLSDPARSSGRDFWKATRLSDKKCTTITHALKRLANKHLRIGLPYLFQDEDQMRHVHRMAIREVPVLATQFEGAWPIKAYLTRYLRKKVSDTNIENLRQARIEEWDSKDRNVEQLGCQRGASERWGDQAEDDRELANLGLGDSPSQAWDRDNQSRSSPTIVVHNDSFKPIPAPPRRPMPNPPVAGPSRSAPVQDFLRSLEPSMEHYLPLFLSWGIQDETALLSLKQWSSEEQDSFLVEKFSRFQIYAIKNGLRGL